MSMPGSRSAARVRLKDASSPATLAVTVMLTVRSTPLTPSIRAVRSSSSSMAGSPVKRMTTSGDCASS